MNYYKKTSRGQSSTRADRARRVTPQARGGIPAGLARLVADPQRSNAENILQLQRLYGNHSVTQLIGGLPRRGDVIQRAGGLPTDTELVNRAGGHGAGKKLFGKSAFKKILNALKAYRNDIGDNDVDGKLDKLVELMGHIRSWRTSSERKTVKTGDAEKRAALATLESEVRAQMMRLASDPQLSQEEPDKLSQIQARIQPWLANTPHLNDASNEDENLRIDRFRTKSPAFRIPAQVNCALCSCAAVIRHLTGLTLTTGDLIIRLHAETNPEGLHYEFDRKLPDNYHQIFQHPGSLVKLGYQKVGPSDIERINATNVAKIQQCCQLFGIEPGPVKRGLPLTTAMTQMQALLSQGYVFAVLVAGEGHWNFAHAGSGGELEFVDYQSDHAEFDGPASGSTPQVGIVNRSIPANDQLTDYVAFRR